MLATLAGLKRLLLIPETDNSSDLDLSEALEAATSAIETRLGRGFKYREWIDRYDGSGMSYLMLRNYPVHTIEYVKIGGADVVDYELLSDQGMLFRVGEWDKDRRNIEVKHTSGYTLPGSEQLEGVQALPKSLERACLILARMLITGEWGKDTERLGSSYAATYTKSEDGCLPAVVETLIRPFAGRVT